MLFLSFLSAVLLWPAVALAAFGYRDDGANYVIDSGADLVIAVSKCCGDIVSMRYKGVECKFPRPREATRADADGRAQTRATATGTRRWKAAWVPARSRSSSSRRRR